MKITIGVTTYNRLETLQKMMKSLMASDLEGFDYTIRVYDDYSSDYGIDELKRAFGGDAKIYRQEHNRGSDYNIGFMYRDFLKTDDDVLFNCDSDLLFHENWLKEGIRLLHETDGILSLFNTHNHKYIKESGEFLIKEDIGSAGTLMTRECVEFICRNISEEESAFALDFSWCKAFVGSGRKLFCTKKSYVQHIGFSGFNSDLGEFDYGEGFIVDGLVNGQILNDALLEATYCSSAGKEKTRPFYYLFPYDRVKPHSKLVIYGAGKVGKEYINQLEATKYCNLVAVVDRNPDEIKGIYSPDRLKDIDCDYVLVAAHFEVMRKEMAEVILGINPSLEDKLIADVCHIINL